MTRAGDADCAATSATLYQTVATVPGQWYDVSAWARQGNASEWIYFYWDGAYGTRHDLTSDWAPYTERRNATQTRTTLNLVYCAHDVIALDTLAVTPVPTAPTSTAPATPVATSVVPTAPTSTAPATPVATTAPPVPTTLIPTKTAPTTVPPTTTAATTMPPTSTVLTTAPVTTVPTTAPVTPLPTSTAPATPVTSACGAPAPWQCVDAHWQAQGNQTLDTGAILTVPLIVNGSLDVSRDAVLVLQYRDAPLLNVSGTISAGGTLVLQLNALNATRLVIGYAGGVLGAFDAVDVQAPDGCARARFEYTPTNRAMSVLVRRECASPHVTLLLVCAAVALLAVLLFALLCQLYRRRRPACLWYSPSTDTPRVRLTRHSPQRLLYGTQCYVYDAV